MNKTESTTYECGICGDTVYRVGGWDIWESMKVCERCAIDHYGEKGSFNGEEDYDPWHDERN